MASEDETSAEGVVILGMAGLMALDHVADIFNFYCNVGRQQQVVATLSDTMYRVRPLNGTKPPSSMLLEGWKLLLRQAKIIPDRMEPRQASVFFTRNIAYSTKSSKISELRLPYFLEALVDVAGTIYGGPGTDVVEAVRLLTKNHLVPLYELLFHQPPQLADEEDDNVAPSSASDSSVTAARAAKPSELVMTTEGPMPIAQARSRGLTVTGLLRKKSIVVRPTPQAPVASLVEGDGTGSGSFRQGPGSVATATGLTRGPSLRGASGAKGRRSFAISSFASATKKIMMINAFSQSSKPTADETPTHSGYGSVGATFTRDSQPADDNPSLPPTRGGLPHHDTIADGDEHSSTDGGEESVTEFQSSRPRQNRFFDSNLDLPRRTPTTDPGWGARDDSGPIMGVTSPRQSLSLPPPPPPPRHPSLDSNAAVLGVGRPRSPSPPPPSARDSAATNPKPFVSPAASSQPGSGSTEQSSPGRSPGAASALSPSSVVPARSVLEPTVQALRRAVRTGAINVHLAEGRDLLEALQNLLGAYEMTYDELARLQMHQRSKST